MPARIIIADDHPLFRNALTRLLEGSAEVEVVAAAADGQQAWSSAATLGPSSSCWTCSCPEWTASLPLVP